MIKRAPVLVLVAGCWGASCVAPPGGERGGGGVRAHEGSGPSGVIDGRDVRPLVVYAEKTRMAVLGYPDFVCNVVLREMGTRGPGRVKVILWPDAPSAPVDAMAATDHSDTTEFLRAVFNRIQRKRGISFPAGFRKGLTWCSQIAPGDKSEILILTAGRPDLSAEDLAYLKTVSQTAMTSAVTYGSNADDLAPFVSGYAIGVLFGGN